ncbi:SUMO-activating enzyme subunit 1B-1 [Selaginella moellendorffii]|uniref:SUMO-activating enzyme subunit 1B-1 n=1 Tax=Selaginella moellendorffii TaxID=88036 RepID=UPI000D1CB0D6|nr:SUMO-activating enzyme subunit 1B-1 isoform X2 [Selaginella moellendorffii]XP_024541612.1 SUMO-activating enzyme subunit 1B-1 [Selaginella moellendorffii]|eukprot:XP_024518819.1 SUMO-activating enzyme subunit 1B-1 isoform X2 [Selaginella moellendorffii]
MEEEAALTEQETAVYDRQIRVWGVQAQRRLSKSRVLVAGLTGVTAEACKNLVLAGIGSLVVLDDRPAVFDPCSSTFLVCHDHNASTDENKSVAEVCAAALRDFNPMVDVTSAQGTSVMDVDNYDVVILNRAAIKDKRRINELCRRSAHKVSFYTVDCIGSRGEIFVDLQTHTYTSKAAADAAESCELTKKFPSFEDVSSVPWNCLPKRISKLFFAMRVLEEFVQATGRQAGPENLPELLALRTQMCSKQGVADSLIPESLLAGLAGADGTEFPPVSAILGGILGQEVVKALSGKGDPLRSFFYFDTDDGKGIIEEIIS